MTGLCGKPLFERVVFCFAFGKALPPAIIVNHDRDVIRVVEGLCAALEGRVIEIPLRRSELPDQLGKLAAIHFIAGPAAFGREIELIPPLQFGFRRQRLLAGLLAADQVSAHRDQRLATLWPKRCHDVGCPRAPVETRNGRLLDLEGVHQRDDVSRDSRGLAVAKSRIREEAGRAMAAQIWNDDAVAFGREQGRDVDKAVDVIGPSVQENDGRAIRGTRFGVSDIQHAGIDLLQRRE